MTTLYKFKTYYTKQGVGAAPSSAPVATVVDTDANTKLANAQATTALSNLVGYYEYEYSGADNLDLVSLFHTTDTTTDQQDLVSYVVDKVYQADKKLDVVQADLDNPNQYKADVSGLATSAEVGAIALLGETVIGTYTVQDILTILAAKMVGKASGGGTTTIKYRGVDDTTDVVVETVDDYGNRSDVTLTV